MVLKMKKMGQGRKLVSNAVLDLYKTLHGTREKFNFKT